MAASLVGPMVLFPNIIWLCCMSHDKVTTQEMCYPAHQPLKQHTSARLTHVEKRWWHRQLLEGRQEWNMVWKRCYKTQSNGLIFLLGIKTALCQHCCNSTWWEESNSPIFWDQVIGKCFPHSCSLKLFSYLFI